MLRHVVLIRWSDDAGADQIAAVVDGLRALPSRIPEIRGYEVGADLGLRDGNSDLAIVAQFDDEPGFRTYLAHPEHVAVVELLTPISAARTSVQFPLDP